MLWVGGGIIVHGMHEYHVPVIPELVDGISHAAEAVPGIGAVTGWLAHALAAAVVGLVVGGVIAGALHFLPKRKKAH
jgi:predicted DNA repair protein MutK